MAELLTIALVALGVIIVFVLFFKLLKSVLKAVVIAAVLLVILLLIFRFTGVQTDTLFNGTNESSNSSEFNTSNLAGQAINLVGGAGNKLVGKVTGALVDKTKDTFKEQIDEKLS